MFIVKYDINELYEIKDKLKKIIDCLYVIIDLKKKNIKGNKLNEKLGEFANLYFDLLKFLGD